MVEEDGPKVMKGDGDVMDMYGSMVAFLVVVSAVAFFAKE
jgi:hypothetical protein